jgi:hypothetical protein
MRARCRPLAAAVVAAASVPLWASPAGAGESYDEFNHTETTVGVGATSCDINVTSYRQGTRVYASTYMQTPSAGCATNRVVATLRFVTEHGDTVTATALDDGPISTAVADGAVDLVRSTHEVTFTSTGSTVTLTLNSK